MDHFGFIDSVAVRIERLEAGCCTDGALDVGDCPAATTDHVVMVVAGLGLVAGDRAGRLDLAKQSGLGEHAQPVVDGLMRNLAQVPSHGLDDRVRIGVGMLLDRGKHRHSGARDTQIRLTQLALEFQGR